MEVFNLLHAKALYLRFSVIYGEKFVKPYHDDDFKSLWYSEWCSGLAGIDVLLIKGCLEHCKVNIQWPPSIAEFRQLCEQSSGVPSASEAFTMAIRKDFSHPIVALAYDKVGSWAMKNDKESVLTGKFQHAYTESLNEYRKNSNDTWIKLEQFNQRQALPEPPSKIPSPQEIIGWRERFQKYNDMAKADKAKLEVKDHPQWDKGQITKGARNFNEIVYNERKRYLLGVDEITAGTLAREDWYDRTRYMREIEADSKVKECSASNPQQKEKMPPRGYNQARKASKSWGAIHRH